MASFVPVGCFPQLILQMWSVRMDQFELLLVYLHPSQQAGLGNVPKCTVPACTSNLSAIAAEAMVVDAPVLTTALTLQMDPLDDPFLFSRCRVQNDGRGLINF